MPRSALAAFAALLDRSLVRIAEAAADARTFDRETVVRCSDVWDNNTLPLWAAAGRRTALRREDAARRGLRWMAAAGAARHAWTVEQSAAAGHPVAGLLPASGADSLRHPYRGYTGQLFPVTVPLTEGAVAGYDLARCRFLSLALELVGERLDARLTLEAPRAYGLGGRTPAQEPLLTLTLTDVSEAEFESGATVTGPVGRRIDAAGVELTLAGRGRLRAARAECHVSDDLWHLTEAGRAADAATPPFRPPVAARPPAPRGHRVDPVAAPLLHGAMLEIRTARYAHVVSRRRILELCRIFEGAGTDLVAAARRGGAGQRALVEGWVERGGSEWAGWFAEQLAVRWRAGQGEDWVGRLIDELRTAPEADRTPARRPGHAALRMLLIGFAGSGHDPDEPASAVVHLAVPPTGRDGNAGGDAGAGDGPWGLLVARIARLERLRLGAGAGAFGTADAAGAVRTEGGLLTVGAGFEAVRRPRNLDRSAVAS
ncbi:hypothetical protein [Kitasatospora sp. NBC_00458]|uniref:hypothetical protein n=1 Tax=Kitasatospora sp. NBC_00458 TaxID=2903568 RepID=UPI002E193FF8